MTISVREENVATNSPPVPRRVTARVLAGETVRIQIPLSGVDPDGDSVQLIGITSNPDKGSVLSTGATYIEFEAGEYSSGTDEFTYALVDGLGARAEGTVRVGISPRLDGARNPVANEDIVSVRPGRTVSVQVLANDSDPDGSPLQVVAVDPNSDDTTAEIVDDAVVDITPPDEPGRYSVIYTIQNEYGGTSQAFVTVEVDPDAPLSYPLAQDTVLTASDVADRAIVDVDVLDNVFFADGDVSDLGVALLPDFVTTAELLTDKRVRVRIGDESQIIPFAVSHPDNDDIRSYAFIWVPGYSDALPQLDRTAPLLTVASEETLTIDLNDYVITLGGQGVRLTDSSTVRATHSDGEDLVVDADTLTFTSADLYFGPASITFEVTDGTSATDPNGRTAILTLPIEVVARDNQPPVFIGGVVDFEPGQEKELDLVRLTNYPYDDIDELRYEIVEPLPEGFTFELNGQRLVLRAAENAVKGTATTITLTVRDDLNEGRAGRIQLQVVPSTLPLVKTVADTAVTPRGTTTTIDVLANDEANNPFPGSPLEVVDIRGLDGASLPEGVTVVPSADNSRLTVTVSPTALPIDTSLQYQVSDATRDSDRYVWGTITISVQDVPDPVTGVTVTEFGDRLLKLSWAPGQFNNSPITGYQVTDDLGRERRRSLDDDLHLERELRPHDPGQRARQRRATLGRRDQRDRPVGSDRARGNHLVGHHPAATDRAGLDPARPGAAGVLGQAARLGRQRDRPVRRHGRRRGAGRRRESQRPGRHLLLGQPDVARDRQRQRGRLRGERAQQRPELPRDLEPGDRRRHPGRPAGAGGTVGVGVGLADRRLDRERLVGRGVRRQRSGHPEVLRRHPQRRLHADLHGDGSGERIPERHAAGRQPAARPGHDGDGFRRSVGEPALHDLDLRLQRAGLHAGQPGAGHPARRAGHRDRHLRAPDGERRRQRVLRLPPQQFRDRERIHRRRPVHVPGSSREPTAARAA